MRDNYPFGLFSTPQDQIKEIHVSSGTTGNPTLVGYTKDDLKLWGDVMARVLGCAGAVPGDTIQIAYGYGLFTGGLGFHYGALEMGLRIIPTSSGQTARQLKLMQDFKPRRSSPARPATCSTWPRRPRNWASTPPRATGRSASSGPSPGASRCGRRSRASGTCWRRTFTACPRSSARASPRNATTRTACTSSATCSIPRSSTPRPASRCPRARTASW